MVVVEQVWIKYVSHLARIRSLYYCKIFIFGVKSCERHLGVLTSNLSITHACWRLNFFWRAWLREQFLFIFEDMECEEILCFGMRRAVIIGVTPV